MTSTVLIMHQGGTEKDVMVSVHVSDTGDIIAEHRLQAGKGTQISLSADNDIVISEVDKLPEQPVDESAAGIIGSEIETIGSEIVNEAEKLAGDVTGNNQTQYEGKTE